MEKTFYEESENNLIKEWYDSSKKGLIYPTTLDFQSQKIVKKFNTWINKVNDLNPQEYFINSMKILGNEMVVKLSLKIIMDIFGKNEDIQQEFFNFFETVTTENLDSLLDGMRLTCYDTTNGNIAFEQTTLPNLNYASSVVAIVHEFAHYFCSKRKLEPAKKRYYNEIISIYCERYAVIFMSQFLQDPEFIKKLESTRINLIVWHQIIHPQEINTVLEEYRNLPKTGGTEVDLVKSAVEYNFPWIKTSQGIIAMRGYKKCMADSYALGYLYASALQRMSLVDEANVKKNMQLFFKGEKSLEELLKYYNIASDNYSIYDDSYQELKKVLK